MTTVPSGPTNEERWLEWARAGYTVGKLTVDEFEASVAHILAGGHVNFDGSIPEPVDSTDRLNAEHARA